MFFSSSDRASSLTVVLAAAARHSAVSAAGVSGLSDDGKVGGEDGTDAFCISVRGAICIQPDLDAGISELVVGVIVREFVREFIVWRGLNRRLLNRGLNGRHAVRLHMFADELNDIVHRGAGLEDA